MIEFVFMGLEQRQEGPRNTFERISTPARYWAENILANTSLSYKESFADSYLQSVSEGYLPVIVANHQSHFDGVSISLVANDLTLVANAVLPESERLKGFMLPLANSLATGNQGTAMKLMYESMRPVIESRNLTPILLTRKKDVTKYNMKSNLKEYLKDLAQGIKDGYSIAFFPEGTVDAGRKDKDGQIKGMQPFSKGGIRSIMITARMAGKKVAFIPVGISGGYEVHNPNTKLPTKKAIAAGFGLGNANLINLKVGLPIRQEELTTIGLGTDKNLQIDYFVSIRLEELIKSNERRRK